MKPEPAAALSERRLRFLWQIDADGSFTVHSDAFLQLVGQATVACLGRPWREIAAELELDREGAVERALAARETFSAIALDWPAGDGKRVAVDLSGLPVFGAERSFRGYRGFGVCRDSRPFPVEASPSETDRGAASGETACDAAPRGPAAAGEPHQLPWSAENVVRFRTGTAPQEVPALTPLERMAFREIADVLTAVQADDEERCRTMPRPAQGTARINAPAPGVFPGISPPTAPPAKSDSAELHKLRAMLDGATDGVVELDRDGRIALMNSAAAALFGCIEDDFAGAHFKELLAPESHRAALAYLESVSGADDLSAARDGLDVIGRVRGGGSVPLFMSLRPIAGMEEFCAFFRDLSRWKATEQELLDAKRRAEEASWAKSEFLAKISHEIRTPLNAIVGFSELMMSECFGSLGNDRYRQYLRDIHASGEHIVSLINDLLDLSKIEAGKFDLGFTRIDLNALLQSCVSIMQPQANRHRIIIRSSLAPTLPAVVADARSMRQILLNLLSNSIKFTGAGGQVIVSTALTDRGEAVLRVRDTGVGMSDKEIETALEPFRQLATSTRFGSGGTGLGLPLSKALAEANRATFSIKSAVNAGTLVEITFPVTRVLAE